MTTEDKICFDRLLPSDTFRPQRSIDFGEGRARAVFLFRKMWINGSTLRVRFIGGTPEQIAIAKEQANWWSQHANLSFSFSNDVDAEIRVSFDSSIGAWSYIGTDAMNIPQDQATMNLGFLNGGTAAHEFGHAIGLAHEHQNPKGGIKWNEAVVIRDLAGPPNNWPEKKARHNVLNKYSANQIRGTEFDPDSIMLYFFPDSWVLNGSGTKANHILSHQDTTFIASAQAYPGRKNDDITKLLANNTEATVAQIGVPGEEDLFKFAVTNSGQHTIETGGQTDVVMKLFGPESKTQLLAEDDDGGQGYNSRIVADLNPGEYYVQIRHYNSNQGTGEYSIRLTT